MISMAKRVLSADKFVLRVAAGEEEMIHEMWNCERSDAELY